MNKLIIILGLVVLSGTNAHAANLPSKDSAMQYFQPGNFISFSNTQLASTKEGRSNTLNLRKNIHLNVTEHDDPKRGSPDTRGEDNKKG